MGDLKDETRNNQSNLFTVRLWCEEQGDCRAEWRGQITNLHSREVRYFRDPETLYRSLAKMASCSGGEGQDSSSVDRNGEGTSNPG